jgi:hypothetical protein
VNGRRSGERQRAPRVKMGRVEQLERDVRTETLSNSRGWTVVRVTHQPTGMTAERARTESLRSAVQAQRECIDELRGRLGQRPPPSRGTAPALPTDRAARAGSGPASQAALDALVARVAQVEERLRRLESHQSRRPTKSPRS